MEERESIQKRAIMVHSFTAEVLDEKWTPTIGAKELEMANTRLAEQHIPWRWRWHTKTSNLAGSITLQNATA
ncbi:MAG: hypothetical protein CMB76_05830 [Euryarchaeota archaeon]|nr:hypothetical protein [Euryarchaeota archaeon]|tara:strand:+ start:2250 stop:2465 length:216 start_codon:yes stop_codon:yes gene_type:complete